MALCCVASSSATDSDGSCSFSQRSWKESCFYTPRRSLSRSRTAYCTAPTVRYRRSTACHWLSSPPSWPGCTLSSRFLYSQVGDMSQALSACWALKGFPCDTSGGRGKLSFSNCNPSLDSTGGSDLPCCLFSHVFIHLYFTLSWYHKGYWCIFKATKSKTS